MTQDHHLVRVAVCVTPDTRRRLEDAAAREDRTLSDYMRRSLVEYLDAVDLVHTEGSDAREAA